MSATTNAWLSAILVTETEESSFPVFICDRLTSSAETTPDITLSVSQIGLNIAQAEIGSGGAIFLSAGSQINTGKL
ncbi:MAG: hypothetical protein AAGM29_11255, partial [Cyanobacteria bacterium J06588_4]